MSTRSILGKPDGEGITGIYHHTDGYPTGMGVFTFRLIRRKYHGDVAAFVADVIESHPGGWSNLYGITDGGEVCYCHDPSFLARDGFHAETYSTHNGDDGGCEWAYSFDAESHIMGIMEGSLSDEKDAEGYWIRRWLPKAIIDLDGPEPDWNAIEGCEPHDSFVDDILPPVANPYEDRLLALTR